MLAANIDMLVVMAAVAPLPDWFIVDRYLCAAELMPAAAVLVFNKVDLLDGHDIEIGELDDYRQIGLPVIETSASRGDGVSRLEAVLAGKRAIIVGQSGVGKSSLVNRLATTETQRTSRLSTKTGEGRHTTANSMMIDLKNGIQLIDSPGVRDYAPALDSARDAARGFVEIFARAGDCRFANCQHLREPDCAVKAAVDDGRIAERRYASYRRLVNLDRQLAARRAP